MTQARGPGILLIGNYPPPFGGIPKHLQDLVPHLVRRGWRVYVLSTGATPDVRGDGFTVYRDRRSPLRRRAGTLAFLAGLSPRALSGAGRLARLMPLRSWLSAITRASIAARIMRQHRIDLVSAYNLLGGAPVGALLAEMFGIPLVVTSLGEVYSHRQAVDAHLKLITHVTQRAARLLAPTRHCASAYRELGLDPPVAVVHHGIHVDAFTSLPDAAAARARFGLRADAVVIGFVGRLVPDMGVQTLLDAAPAILERRADAALLVAGAGGALEPAVRQVADRWPGRVALAVDVPEAQLPEVYAASDLIVVPTRGRRACGSLAAAEAMAAGRPVIAAAVGGIPEFVAADETGVLVQPDDPEALARTVIELAAQPDRRAEFGAAGRQRVRSEFDREKTNQEFEALFRTAAASAAA